MSQTGEFHWLVNSLLWQQLIYKASGFSFLPKQLFTSVFIKNPLSLPSCHASCLPFGCAAWNWISGRSECCVWCTAFGCSFGGWIKTTSGGGPLPPASSSVLPRPARRVGVGPTVRAQCGMQHPRTNGLVSPAPVPACMHTPVLSAASTRDVA
jgi:hypothetical protein